jgi:hypothetical protein
MASTNTRWFVVASPTGSTQNQFFDISASSEAANSGSNFINLNAIVGNSATPVVNWGTAGTFPTNSVYSPGIYIRDLYNDPYTSSFYSYQDDNTDLLEISIQQDLQKIFFPGIVTGSSAYGFGGKVAITGSASPVGSALTGSIGFQSTITPTTFTGVVSMSFAANTFNRVNFGSFFALVDSGYRFIYRDFQSGAEAVYTVDSPYNAQHLIENSFYNFAVTYVSSTGTLILNNSSSVTFIDTAENQQTFYIVGVANPRGDKPFANQFTVGTDGVNGDFRSGLIKVYATESNNTADWNSLIKSISGDPSSVYTDPTSVAANHNLFMFTASAGSPGTGSWELLANLA